MVEDRDDEQAELQGEDLVLLGLLARGVDGAELARRLGVTPRTVQRRIQRLKQHFDVPSTVQVVVAAVRAGVI